MLYVGLCAQDRRDERERVDDAPAVAPHLRHDCNRPGPHRPALAHYAMSGRSILNHSLHPSATALLCAPE